MNPLTIIFIALIIAVIIMALTLLTINLTFLVKENKLPTPLLKLINRKETTLKNLTIGSKCYVLTKEKPYQAFKGKIIETYIDKDNDQITLFIEILTTKQTLWVYPKVRVILNKNDLYKTITEKEINNFLITTKPKYLWKYLKQHKQSRKTIRNIIQQLIIKEKSLYLSHIS